MSYLLAEPDEFPDVETLVMDIATGITVDGVALGPDGTGTRTPLDRSARFVHVTRASGVGGVSPYGDLDTAVVYVASYGESHDVSRQITQGLRRELLAFRDGGNYKGVDIHRIRESSAPAPMPLVDEDDRRVEAGYTVLVRPHDGVARFT